MTRRGAGESRWTQTSRGNPKNRSAQTAAAASHSRLFQQLLINRASTGACFFLSSLTQFLLRSSWLMMRGVPCHALQDIRLVDNCGGKFGFISSHSSNSFAIAFFISLLMKNKWWFFSLFSWATLISYSRIYLGVHYPFDVFCGMFWGLFVSLLVYFVYKMKLKKFDSTWAVWFLLVCIWNFGWSNAPAIADIFVAVSLSLLVIYFKKKNKWKSTF